MVGPVGSEGRGSDDDFIGTLIEKRLRSLHGADAAAGADYGLGGKHRHERAVGSAAHRGIEIYDLDLGKEGELREHGFGAVAFESFLAALHQLDHRSIHQIDTREDQLVFLTGMPARSRCSFRSLTV